MLVSGAKGYNSKIKISNILKGFVIDIVTEQL